MANDGRAVMLAIDHGYFMGATHGMEKPAQSISNLLPHVDSLMLTAGVLRTDVKTDFGKGIVLRASGGNTVLDNDIDNEEIILSAMEAVKLNASAVAVSIFVGAEYSHQTIMNLAQMVEDASSFDLPVLGVTAVGKALKDKKEKRYLTHASRLAAELGADIVKPITVKGLKRLSPNVRFRLLSPGAETGYIRGCPESMLQRG